MAIKFNKTRAAAAVATVRSTESAAVCELLDLQYTNFLSFESRPYRSLKFNTIITVGGSFHSLNNTRVFLRVFL